MFSLSFVNQKKLYLSVFIRRRRKRFRAVRRTQAARRCLLSNIRSMVDGEIEVLLLNKVLCKLLDKTRTGDLLSTERMWHHLEKSISKWIDDNKVQLLSDRFVLCTVGKLTFQLIYKIYQCKLNKLPNSSQHIRNGKRSKSSMLSSHSTISLMSHPMLFMRKDLARLLAQLSP